MRDPEPTLDEPDTDAEVIHKLQARIDALEAALDALQSAETAYRMSFGLHGYHDQHTLEARDALGTAGYRARKVLSAARAALDKDAP